MELIYRPLAHFGEVSLLLDVIRGRAFASISLGEDKLLFDFDERFFSIL